MRDAGRLVYLPVLIDHYTPDMDRLPLLILSLVRDVDWQTEAACFADLCRVREQAQCHPHKGSPDHLWILLQPEPCCSSASLLHALPHLLQGQLVGAVAARHVGILHVPFNTSGLR